MIIELYEAMRRECDALREQLEAMQKDMEEAAGELPMPIPEPGTDMAKLMSANILLRRENERLRHQIIDCEEEARRKTAAEVIQALMPVGPLTNRMPSRYLSLVEEYIVEQFSLTDEDIEGTFKYEFEQRQHRQDLLDDLRAVRHERDEARRKLAEASKTGDGPEDGWIEGLPTEPGDYWFYVLHAGYPSKVKQGRSAYSANGILMHVATDFLYPQEYGTPTRRVWHRRLVLPDPPEFDRTCPSCDGKGKKHYRDCFDCRGKGEI